MLSSMRDVFLWVWLILQTISMVLSVWTAVSRMALSMVIIMNRQEYRHLANAPRLRRINSRFVGMLAENCGKKCSVQWIESMLPVGCLKPYANRLFHELTNRSQTLNWFSSISYRTYARYWLVMHKLDCPSDLPYPKRKYRWWWSMLRLLFYAWPQTLDKSSILRVTVNRRDPPRRSLALCISHGPLFFSVSSSILSFISVVTFLYNSHRILAFTFSISCVVCISHLLRLSPTSVSSSPSKNQTLVGNISLYGTDRSIEENPWSLFFLPSW